MIAFADAKHVASHMLLNEGNEPFLPSFAAKEAATWVATCFMHSAAKEGMTEEEQIAAGAKLLMDRLQHAPMYHDAALGLATLCIMRGFAVPKELSELVVSVLRSESTRPKGRRPPWQGFFYRDMKIQDAIAFLIENGASLALACEAVAAALSEARLMPSNPKTIRRIFKRMEGLNPAKPIGDHKSASSTAGT